MFRELKFGGAGSTRLKMPESDFDKAATAVLVGIAFIVASTFLPVYDFVFSLSAQSGSGAFIKSEGVAKKGNREFIGVYEFSDNLGSKVSAKSKYSFKEKAKIPKTAKIAWKPGEPQNARVLYQGGFSPFVLIFGLCLTMFGIYRLMKIRKKGSIN